jgi:colicin import membrane protein
MTLIKSDDWELFLEERHKAPGWQWPLNLAVALHLAIFAGAIVLPDITARKPQFTDIVMVDLIDFGGLPGLASTPVALLSEAALEPIQEAASEIKIASTPPIQLSPERAVKQAVTPAPPPVQEVPEPVQPEVAVIEPEPKQKTAAAHKETVVEEVIPAVTPRESIALTPEQRKVAVEQPQVSASEEKKKAEETKAAKIAEEKKKAEETKAAKIAEEKKKAEETKAAKISEEKKKAEETKAAKIAEEKKKAEETKAAKIAEEKKKAEETKAAKIAEEKKKAEETKAAKIAEEKKKAEATKAVKIAEEKKKAEEVRQQRLVQERQERETRRQAEQARAAEVQRQRAAEQERQKALAVARRIEREAEQALAEAEEARKELAQAQRQNTAVRSAVAAASGGIRGGSGSGVISPTVLHQYGSLLNGKISSHWKVPELVKTKPDLKTQVVLTVRKNGSIENMKIERKSGDALFDQSVLRALQNAEPLPSFPALISQPALEVELNFTPKGLTL